LQALQVLLAVLAQSNCWHFWQSCSINGIGPINILLTFTKGGQSTTRNSSYHGVHTKETSPKCNSL